MEITKHGLIKPANDDFYNIDDFNNNTGILENHLDDDKIHITNEERNTWNSKVAENDLSTRLLNMVYPVGSIYMSVNNVSPSKFLGGTWSMLGEGQVLMSANPSGTTYKTSEATGGSATTKLSTANLPSHAHSFSGSATPSGTVTTTSTTCDAQGNHYHTAGSLSAAATGISGRIANIVVQGSEGMNAYGVFTSSLGGETGYYGGNTNGGAKCLDAFDMNATHGHGISGNTEWAGSHAHNIGVSSSFSGNSLTISGTTGAQGSETAFSNLQPYMTTYMWKRTA